MIVRLDDSTVATAVNDLADLCADEFSQFGVLNRQHFCDVWKRFLSGAPDFTICLSAVHAGRVVGVLFGLVIPDDITGELKAVEAHWVVAPEWRNTGAGLRLLKQFERAAKTAGAKRIICGSYACGDLSRMRAIYARCGYTLHAEAFSKRV